MISEALREKIVRMRERMKVVETELAKPSTIRDIHLYKELSREHNQLNTLKQCQEEYEATDTALQEAKELRHSDDEEFSVFVKEEIARLEKHTKKLYTKLRELVLPGDPFDAKTALMEIRAGTGGEEASLFSADLFRMYSRFAESRNWDIHILHSHALGIGGYKEIMFSINGPCFGFFKHERGTHRVQRVPTTESSGRIHTSAVTVAVFPEVEEKDVTIAPEDIRIDTFRSSGPGGQSVNTTDSAIRVTHVPSGITVSCQDEKSQHKNKAKALRILRARLVSLDEERRLAELSETRRAQIGSGDRSQRIRTYNFPQNRVTDHRTNTTIYHLEKIMEGDLEDFFSLVRVGLHEID